MTRRDIGQWARRNWWEIIVVLALPVLVWGAKRYDASKLDVRAHERALDSLRLQYVRDSLHHVRDDFKLEYLVCRQDFTRKECLRPDRP